MTYQDESGQGWNPPYPGPLHEELRDGLVRQLAFHMEISELIARLIFDDVMDNGNKSSFFTVVAPIMSMLLTPVAEAVVNIDDDATPEQMDQYMKAVSREFDKLVADPRSSEQQPKDTLQVGEEAVHEPGNEPSGENNQPNGDER